MSAVSVALLLAAVNGAIVGAAYGSLGYAIGLIAAETHAAHGGRAVLAVGAFGVTFWVLSRIVLLSSKLAGVRSMSVPRIIGLCSGVACVYAAWAAHATWCAPDHRLTIAPAAVFAHVARHLHAGWLTPIISALEAGTLAFLTSHTARRFMIETPFCAGCREWLSVELDVRRIGVANLHDIVPRLAEGRVDVLDRAMPAGPHDYVRLDLAMCRRCGTGCYLTAVRRTTKSDDRGHRGRARTWEECVIRNLPIRPEDGARIRARQV